MNNKILYPENVFKCPNCGCDQTQGFDFENHHCNHCGTNHFSLGDVLCLFPEGKHHKVIWEHQTGIMKYAGEQGLITIQESLSRYDLSETTRQRLTETFNATEINLKTILSLLQESGIEAAISEQLGGGDPGDLSEYFDFILRDWAWDSVANPSAENNDAVNRLLSLIDTFPSKPKRVLVLGAGAGRLSWDLHSKLKPEYTIALDSNPLLLIVADQLIRQQKTLTFGEFKLFPQITLPTTQLRTLDPPADPENLRARWFGLCADVWQLPLNFERFDLIVTPWFIDVNGGDLRDLIGRISQSLESGGHWLNSGPLLFTRRLPLQLKYSAAEIKEFIALSGFTLTAEKIEKAGHLLSPLEVRHREEQLWTFSACKESLSDMPVVAGVSEAWLVMHHLSIPRAEYSSSDEHPLIDLIFSLVDGNRSINDICSEVVAHIPQDIDVRDVVVTLFGQITAKK